MAGKNDCGPAHVRENGKRLVRPKRA